MIVQKLTTKKNDRCKPFIRIGKYHLDRGIQKHLHTSINKNSVSGWISIFGYFLGYSTHGK